MWLRVTMKDRPMMINADRVVKIVEIPGGTEGIADATCISRSPSTWKSINRCTR